MVRNVKAAERPLTAEEKIALLEEERRVLRDETHDTPSSLERVEIINRDIAVLQQEISERPAAPPAPASTDRKP